jgi:hypothetical protein
MNANQFKGTIDGHAKAAAEHYMTVMDIKEDGTKTLEAAIADKDDLDKLLVHKEVAKQHASNAEEAFGKAKSASTAAT